MYCCLAPTAALAEASLAILSGVSRVRWIAAKPLPKRTLCDTGDVLKPEKERPRGVVFVLVAFFVLAPIFRAMLGPRWDWLSALLSALGACIVGVVIEMIRRRRESAALSS